MIYSKHRRREVSGTRKFHFPLIKTKMTSYFCCPWGTGPRSVTKKTKTLTACMSASGLRPSHSCVNECCRLWRKCLSPWDDLRLRFQRNDHKQIYAYDLSKALPQRRFYCTVLWTNLNITRRWLCFTAFKRFFQRFFVFCGFWLMQLHFSLR